METELRRLMSSDGKLLGSIHREPQWQTAIQMFIPFFLGGLGMVLASFVYESVQDCPAYQNIKEINILVVALLGLKGNLEMTLASRLSTYTNLGYFANRKQKNSLISGNVAIVLCQAVVVGFLASVAAVILDWIPSGEINMQHAVLLCASSILTAFLASLALTVIIIPVIIYSSKIHINPDNIATPIAASLGDILTLAILSYLTSLFYEIKDSHLNIAAMSGIVCLLLAPFWARAAYRNHYTHDILYSGWSPIIASMIISSVGGLVLNVAVNRFKGIAIYQLVINGIGGNIVSVQASRMSTELHYVGQPGHRTENLRVCVSPIAAFCEDTKCSHGSTARLLLFMMIPGQIIFCYIISHLKGGETYISFLFFAVYLTAAIVQVTLLLYIAQIMTLSMWKLGINPDNSAIPYLTAVGDLIGTMLLSLAFHILYLLGDESTDLVPT